MKKSFIKVLTLILLLFAIICVNFACNQQDNDGDNAHVHEYSNFYYYDSEYHWFECKCGEDKDKEEHSYTDGLCVCGKQDSPEKGEHIHSFLLVKSDEIKHWFECECGEKSGFTVHVFKGGVCVCGREEKVDENIDGHTLSDWIVDTEPTCTSKGIKYKKCTDEGCGAIVLTEEIPEIAHKYEERKYNVNSHWNECICGKKIAETPHDITTETKERESSVNPCVTSWVSAVKKCKECDYSQNIFTDPTGHNYSNIKASETPDFEKSGKLTGDCSECKQNGFTWTNINICTLPALDSYGNNYIKENSKTDTGCVTAYKYNYKNCNYTVAVKSREHFQNTSIDDYTKEQYPQVKFTESVSCTKYCQGTITCEYCLAVTNISVKASHSLVANGDFVYDVNEPVTIPVKCSNCTEFEPTTVTCKIVDTVGDCSEIIIKYTLNNKEVISKIIIGRFAKHTVTVAGKNFYFTEEGTYTYLDLGLSADAFSGNVVPDCQTEKLALVKCEACEKNVGVWVTGEHKYNDEPDIGTKNEYTCTIKGCGSVQIIPS